MRALRWLRELWAELFGPVGTRPDADVDESAWGVREWKRRWTRKEAA